MWLPFASLAFCLPIDLSLYLLSICCIWGVVLVFYLSVDCGVTEILCLGTVQWSLRRQRNLRVASDSKRARTVPCCEPSWLLFPVTLKATLLGVLLLTSKAVCETW